MYSLGIDIGSSSVKVSVLDTLTGEAVGSAFSPKQEMAISSPVQNWAEQNPELWWENFKLALAELLSVSKIDASKIQTIGIGYQMHGLVAIDKSGKVVRPSIIWCDSRAVEIGNKAFNDLGGDFCLQNFLNSPGNFTASKLKWVKENEPKVYETIYKIMLPGDYIAYRLTGNILTSKSGLSEGIFWNFKENRMATELLTYYGINENLMPDVVDSFSEQGSVMATVAGELGLSSSASIFYRAGDQPNNALSLNVLEPGEVAATAGTSGVVYGVTDQIKSDPLSRVNTFLHVNHTDSSTRLGVLLCVNGTGILNSWVKKNFASHLSYSEMNEVAMGAPIGADGLSVIPFGNGAERMLQNKNLGASFQGLHFNSHQLTHILRATQEGIAFSFNLGLEIMHETGLNSSVIKAGKANLFLSPLFRQTVSNITGSTIELYETDGALGAARGAALGAKFYKTAKEAFSSLKKLEVVEPQTKDVEATQDAFSKWKQFVIKQQ